MSVRSRIGIGIGMCAMVSLLVSNVVFAADAPAAAPTGTVQERLTALETKTDAPGLWTTLGFKVSGAAEASFTQNFNNPGTNVNSLRVFDTQANSFVPQVAQFMMERPATDASALDRVGFRARVNYGAQSRFSRARTNYQPGTDNTELDVHELYGEYIVPLGNGLKIQFGKINTLIGLEVINSWENPNFSRSWTFGLAQAFTETGIRATYAFGSWATLAVGLINGWDNIEDNNRGKTVTWNLNLTPAEVFGIIFYGGYGPEQSNGNAIGGNAAAGSCVNFTTGCDPSAKRLVVGSLITLKPTSSDTLILEPYYGNESNASGIRAANGQSPNARWNALLAYYTHDFNDQTQPHAFSLRIRGEIFEDAGGARTCVGGANFNGGSNSCAQFPGAIGFVPVIPGPSGSSGLFNGATGGGVVQTLWGITSTLQWKPAPPLIVRAEFRYDKSNKNSFVRGTPDGTGLDGVNNQQTMGFSVTYLF